MKIESNQDIRTTGVISVIILLSVCAIAASPLWSSKSKEENEITLRRAESLAYQIIEIQKLKNADHLNSRSPASVDQVALTEGHMGLDPWGQPYRFQVVNHGSERRVVVCSLGPDRQLQTNLSNLDSSRDSSPLKIKGDDVGVTVDFK